VEDFNKYIVETHAALGTEGASSPAADILYNTKNLNKIMDNPYVEDSLRNV